MSGLHPNSVVVPVDFSDESIAAVDTAVEIAGDASKVHVIHVLPELHSADPGVIWQTIDNANRSKHATEALRDRLNDPKFAEVFIHVEFGDPGHRISKHAENTKADLIVIPSHGRSGISRMLLGSVAERVLRMSHCPVLVLRQ